MKTLTTLWTILILTTAIKAQPCSDLLISELVFDNHLMLLKKDNYTETIQKNHVVELFNPTSETIELTNYKLKLLTETNTVTEINLTGSIPSKETFVISNATADLEIIGLSDFLTDFLIFDSIAILQLTNNGAIIDEVGEQSLGTEIDDINLDSLLNNPDYLNNLNINFQSIENLVVRRKPVVQIGAPDFEVDAILEEWIFYPNSFIEDLGLHFNACVAPILNWKDYSWIYPELTVKEGAFSGKITGTVEILGTLDNFVLVNTSATLHEFAEPPAGNAYFEDFEHDPLFDFEIPPYTSEYTIELCSIIDDSGLEGNEGVGFWLHIYDDNGTGAQVGFDRLFDILILDDETSSFEEHRMASNDIKVFPTTITNDLFIEPKNTNLTIQKVNLFEASGKFIKSFNIDPSGRSPIRLDMSFLQQSGYHVLVIKTNEGYASKVFIKH